MNSDSLRVVVQKNGACHFTWTLVAQHNSYSLGQCVVSSVGRFANFDEALDAGFEALQRVGS